MRDKGTGKDLYTLCHLQWDSLLSLPRASLSSVSQSLPFQTPDQFSHLRLPVALWIPSLQAISLSTESKGPREGLSFW